MQDNGDRRASPSFIAEAQHMTAAKLVAIITSVFWKNGNASFEYHSQNSTCMRILNISTIAWPG
jgi:hypothetical protein